MGRGNTDGEEGEGAVDGAEVAAFAVEVDDGLGGD